MVRYMKIGKLYLSSQNKELVFLLSIEVDFCNAYVYKFLCKNNIVTRKHVFSDRIFGYFQEVL